MTPAGALRVPIRIGADHPCLAGHFPGKPVVPGVLLLDEVARALERASGTTLRALPSVKFLAPLLPDEAAELVLLPGDARVRFRIERDGMPIAQGEAEVA